MKKLLLSLILMCIIPLSHAQDDDITLFDHGDFVIEMALKKEPGWEELLNYFVTCRLDEICILQSLRQSITFTNPPDLIKRAYEKYSAKQTDIYTHYQYCRLRDLVKVKEALSVCYGKLNDPNASDRSDAELLSVTALCMESNLLKLAAKDNLFAIRSLVDLYKETGKPQNADIWQKVLDTQGDDPNLEFVSTCVENMYILKP